MTIGERIKAKRKEKNISVEYVAKALGVSVSTVYRYEDSTIEKIPIKVFDKLCQIFETSASELMGNDSTVQKRQTVNCQENLKMHRMQWNLCLKCRHWRHLAATIPMR